MSDKDTAAFLATQHPTETNLDETALQIPVTLLRGTNPAPTGYSTLGEVFARMRNADPAKREKVLTLRQLAYKAKIEGDETAYKEQKETLSGFLIGRWTRRSDAPENCTQYAPFLVLDFDYSCFYEPDAPPFSNEVCQEVFLKICSDPHTLAAFMSPSGGLRVIVHVESNYHSHRETYARLMEYYSCITGLPILKSKKQEGRKIANAPFGIDSTCQNESRFFYFVEGLAADEFYLNENSREFVTETAPKSSKGEKAPTTRPAQPKAVKQPNNAPQLTDAERWELYEMMTDERHSPTAHTGRNGRVLFLAQLAHDHGETESDILAYCLQFEQPDFKAGEITSTVKSAVKRTNGSKFDFQNLVHYKAKREKEAKQDKAKPEKKSKGDGEQLPYNRMVKYLQRNYEFQLDMVGNELEYRPKGTKDWQVLNENNLLHELRAKGHKVTDTLLMSLLGSDFVPRFDPFLTYFKSLPAHDPAKGSPIDRMADFVTLKDEAKDRDWFNRMYRKMLVRVAAAAIGRIPFNKQCFVLKSDQNDGKSTLIRHHCPPVLAKYRADWTRDEVSDKDGRFALAQNFLINLDELATFGKANIEQTKALMSLDSIKDRPPYGKRPIRFPRRASFFGSTNKDEFLTDESGSVRWLVFEIAGIQHDNGGANGYGAKVDINAVWAEAWHLLNTGEIDPMLSREEIAESEARNKVFQVPTPEMDMVREYLSKTNKDENGAEFMNTTAITNYLCGLTNLRLNKNYVGAALKYLGWEKSEAYNRAKKYQDHGYWVKKEATQQSDFE
jgi:hypothetical protein